LFSVRAGLVRTAQLVALVLCLNQLALAQDRNLLVIVDMEPDDRVALMLLAAEFPAEIAFVGTTGMHAGRKAALARQFMDQIGLDEIPVVQGSGGEASSYPEIASSKAAREYQFEGRGLIPKAELAKINSDVSHSSEKLSQKIRALLLTQNEIEIALLAPATDLVHALEENPGLEAHIAHIHLMAGWSLKLLPSGEIDRRTTYNWNTDPDAGAKPVSIESIPMTLYSSHMIKSSFSGGSINNDGFPAIISELVSRKCQVPAFETFLFAADSWDHHLMENIPPLRTVIGDHAG